MELIYTKKYSDVLTIKHGFFLEHKKIPKCKIKCRYKLFNRCFALVIKGKYNKKCTCFKNEKLLYGDLK